MTECGPGDIHCGRNCSVLSTLAGVCLWTDFITTTASQPCKIEAQNLARWSPGLYVCFPLSAPFSLIWLLPPLAAGSTDKYWLASIVILTVYIWFEVSIVAPAAALYTNKSEAQLVYFLMDALPPGVSLGLTTTLASMLLRGNVNKRCKVWSVIYPCVIVLCIKQPGPLGISQQQLVEYVWYVFVFALQPTDIFPAIHNLWVLPLPLSDPYFGATNHVERVLLFKSSSVNIMFANRALLEPLLFLREILAEHTVSWGRGPRMIQRQQYHATYFE